MKDSKHIFVAIILIVSALTFGVIIFFSIRVAATIREDGLKNIIEEVWEGEDNGEFK